MPVSIGQALGLATEQAECLPLPEELNGLGIKIRKANLVMIAGAPGVGKSMFADWFNWKIDLPTLSFSADMTPFDTVSRAAARQTGDTLTTVEQGLQGSGLDFYKEALADLPIDYCFDSTLSLDDIVAELDAYVEVNDQWPESIVIDHLNKLEASEDYHGQKYILGQLHTLAHHTGSTVFILHHASEANQKDPTMPASKKEIENKMTHFPELVLTVALDQVSQVFRVAVVKNRSGFADATGKTFIELAADPARSTYHRKQDPVVADFWRGIE